MKKFLSIIVVAAAFSIGAAAQDEVIQDWAGNGRYNEANQALTTAPKAVFYGDSITDSWAQEWGDPAFFSDNNFVGRGYSGHTTFQMLVRFRQDVVDLHPKYVVILAGTNDLAENLGPVDPNVTLGCIKDMCEIAQANRIRPIICSVLPAYRYGWRPDIDAAKRIADFNIILRKYATEVYIPYVDYYEAMVDERGGLPENFSGDGVHPTFEGYKVMESIVLPFLK